MAKIQSKEESLKVRLGSDTVFPLAGNFESISGLDVLLQDIQLLLLTIPGERPFRPDFGCELKNQLWENLETAKVSGEASIRDAINRFEPRITLTNITSNINRNTSLITFNIAFIVNADDTEVNLIFPFRAGTQLSFK